MKTTPKDIKSIRRAEIVEAAVAVIAEKGLQNLSLSHIEEQAGMSRGQLTYYFAAKEQILLAVFDRLLEVMRERAPRPAGTAEDPCHAGGLEMVKFVLHLILHEPAGHPEFHALQYTFLSQISHREDFRERLASLYEEWRAHLAGRLAADQAEQPQRPSCSPRLLASLIQALFHGLAVQLAADPEAFPRQEMFDLCLDVLHTYWQGSQRPGKNGTTTSANQHAPRPRSQAAKSPRRRLGPKG